MKKNITIKIENPCHEDWSAMTPVEQGRFCDSCSKRVVDFGKMSDNEIIRLIETAKEEKMCGRFNSSQLNRSIIPTPLPTIAPYAASNTSFSLRAVMLGASLSALLGLESCNTGKAVSGEMWVVDHTEQVEETKKGEVSLGYDHSAEHLITGVLYGPDSTTIADVEVVLYDQQGEEVGKTFSKSDGSFRLEIDWKKNPYSFQCFKDHYYSMSYTLSETQLLQEMNIYMEEIIVMGEFVPVEKAKKEKKNKQK